MSVLALLNRFLKGGRRFYAGAAVSVLLAAVVGYLSPFVLRFTIDSVIGDQPASFPSFLGIDAPSAETIAYMQSNLWVCGLALVAFTAVQGAFTILRTVWASKACERFAENLRNALYDHIARLPYLSYSMPATGDVIQRCSSDVETVTAFIQTQAVEVWRILIMIAIAVPLMLSLDTTMTIASTFLLPVVLACSIVYFVKVKRKFQSAVELEARMTTVAQENLTGVRLVRAFQRQEHEIAQFAEANSAYRDKMLELISLVSAFWASTACLCMAQITLTILVGTVRVANGDMTLGTMTVFVTYVGMLVWPIRMLGHVLSDLGRSYVSFGRIRQILDQPAEAADDAAGTKPEIHGRIEFRDVAFRYTEDDEPALSGVSFVAEPGQTVAIVGHTGSGKSTLVNVIPRLLDYTEGSILVDGCELRDIDRRWMRRHVGTVLQEPFLFGRTIRENIALGVGREVSDQAVATAARTAAIHETIEKTFGDGYNAVVGERGVTLSGGQRQRVAIARALLPEPPILIFDDSLSAVDAETDVRIQTALAERRGRATTFIVSHRVSSVAGADLILVLENGRITESGTHAELARRPGLYQRMCHIQEELAEEIEDAGRP